MPVEKPTLGQKVVVERRHFDDLLGGLRERGYRLVGPTRLDGAIVYDEIETAEQLPAGWKDVQEAGRYRLERRQDAALFGYNSGPHSWKKFLHVPRQRLWRARRDEPGGACAFLEEQPVSRKLALVGVRACELRAIEILDRVLAEDRLADPHYAARRRDLFVVAVNCTQAGGTCFCASMGAGPRVGRGFDLALTERPGPEGHEFVVEAGSDAGVELLGEVPCRTDGIEASVRAADEMIDRAAQHMGRSLDMQGVRDLLYRNLLHKLWEPVAERCLGCASCTLVCPTCFCTDIEDTTDLAGEHAERTRVWDSCFSLRFSYIAGGNVRSSLASRYRQWLTHKFAGWVDQYGTSGCVGCGHCITWCPAGIDVTAEVRAFREAEAAAPAESEGA